MEERERALSAARGHETALLSALSETLNPKPWAMQESADGRWQRCSWKQVEAEGGGCEGKTWQKGAKRGGGHHVLGEVSDPQKQRAGRRGGGKEETRQEEGGEKGG